MVGQHQRGPGVQGDAETPVQTEHMEQRHRDEQDVGAVIGGGSSAATCSRLARRADELSMAPRGRPVVPLV